MLEFLALLETQVGKAIVAKFSHVAGMTQEAMVAEIKSNAPLARHFVEVAAKVVGELKQEAA